MRLPWLLLLVPGCSVGGVPKYAGAGIAVGSMVGATAVNRVITGECWARCSKGWHCNHKSGVCERETNPPGVHPIRRPPATLDAGTSTDAAPTSTDAAPTSTDAEPDSDDAASDAPPAD